MLGVYYQLTEKVLCVDGFGMFCGCPLKSNLLYLKIKCSELQKNHKKLYLIVAIVSFKPMLSCTGKRWNILDHCQEKSSYKLMSVTVAQDLRFFRFCRFKISRFFYCKTAKMWAMIFFVSVKLRFISKLTSSNQEKHLEEGSNEEIDCRVKAEDEKPLLAPPKIAWSKDNKPLHSTSFRYKRGNSSFSVAI